MGKQHEVSASWSSDLKFIGEVNDQVIALNGNGSKESGEATPKPLMLLALAGCTGMDVISILKKMHQNIEDFNVTVSGDLTDDYPITYKKMHIIYAFKGKELSHDKLQRAIELSLNKYCGVAAIYKHVMEVSYEIQIISD